MDSPGRSDSGMDIGGIEMRPDFYSNCLIEAIKAKIKNPTNIKIMFVKPHHFMWYEKSSDKVYDFYQRDTFQHWYQMVWHRGYIYCWKYEAYRRWKGNLK